MRINSVKQIIYEIKMKNLKFLALVILEITMLLNPEILFCQNNTENNDYRPELGQAGKDVIWYPTHQLLVDVMIDMANLTPDDYLIDLGSGDGRIVIAAAKRGIRAAGIEYNPDLIEFSKKSAEKEGVADKTVFIQADLFEYDLSKATVITMFLLTDINRRLRPKLLELKPGTRIVTNTFLLQDWPYDEMKRLDTDSITWNTAYLWIVPAKVEGTWKYNNGELTLTQVFQMVSGYMYTGNKSNDISDGRLRGDIFSFTCDGVKYDCRVDENVMEGTAERNGESKVWEAVRKD